MDKIKTSLNSKGFYQKIIILLSLVLPFTTYFIVAGFAYLTYQPVTQCNLKGFDSIFDCTHEDYCNNKENFEIHIIKEKSLDNIMTNFKIFCGYQFISTLNTFSLLVQFFLFFFFQSFKT